MFNSSHFSFTKVINGISKSLSIANQIIPLYQQTRPIINNVKKVLTIISEPTNTKKITNKKNTDIKIINQANPVFFQ